MWPARWSAIAIRRRDREIGADELGRDGDKGAVF